MQHFLMRMVTILAAVLIATPAFAGPSATSVTYGPASATRPGIVTTGTQSFAGNKTFLGTTSITDYTVSGTSTFSGTATFNKTAETGASEQVATFKTSDAVVGSLSLNNYTASNNLFAPYWNAVADSNANIPALLTRGQIGTAVDSGSVAVFMFDVKKVNSTAITTRPLFDILNNATTVLSALPLNSGANLALSWGTQTGAAPAFTTRSAGTRLVLYSAISGTKVDNAIGVTANGAANTYSVQEATSSYAHDFYAGTTLAFRVRGDGFTQQTGGELHKVRVATTTPVTCASGTDRYVITKLAAPGAVAVTLPTGVTGQEITIIDGTGDAAANNITVSPVSGTINGAATYVINANYGKATFVYSGTEWLVAG